MTHIDRIPSVQLIYVGFTSILVLCHIKHIWRHVMTREEPSTTDYLLHVPLHNFCEESSIIDYLLHVILHNFLT